MKKCPYLTKKTRIEKFQQSPNEDNENMVSDGTTTICEKEEHTNCLEHECGAYYDGRCHYPEHV